MLLVFSDIKKTRRLRASPTQISFPSKNGNNKDVQPSFIRTLTVTLEFTINAPGLFSQIEKLALYFKETHSQQKTLPSSPESIYPTVAKINHLSQQIEGNTFVCDLG